jgi:hypothetical protein
VQRIRSVEIATVLLKPAASLEVKMLTRVNVERFIVTHTDHLELADAPVSRDHVRTRPVANIIFGAPRRIKCR